MPAFPLFKLVGTLVKIGAKPLANRVKISAKNSPKVQAIARWSGQTYHRWDVYYRTKLIGVKSDAANIKPLTDEMAVEEGANIISESIIYLTPLIIFFADYYYTKAKTRNKEEDQVQYLKSLERRIQEMELKEEQHFAQYRELQRFCSAMFQDCEKMVKEKTI
ncbi:hypothetical protein ACJMK2_037629 [Sinanodonta woodiana]|uniref:Uncharacterized protein n=1 Tax=Sinanodonta woodiana TaxID=1069815 RepID=A0ABD3WLF7_SINWO